MSDETVKQSSPTWPCVLAFARRMEAKLAKNRHKGDREAWLKDTPTDLHDRVEDEVADVANMAMMTADAFDPSILAKLSAESDLLGEMREALKRIVDRHLTPLAQQEGNDLLRMDLNDVDDLLAKTRETP